MADELASSLDDKSSKLVMDLLSEINGERRVTVILTTTDLYEGLPTDRDFVLKDCLLIEC